ncbi:MAG TPA: AAA family ATPase [Conexibacter sp.]|nr:AAA family ATPase [Conexibacter sp.]
MRLRRLTIERFRAFERAEFTLPKSGLLLIAGANNSGKSAVLSAVDVVAGEQVPSPRHHRATRPATIEAEFELSDRERAAMFGPGKYVDSWLHTTEIFRRIACRLTEDDTGNFFISALAAFPETSSPREEFAKATAGNWSNAAWTIYNVNELGHSHDPYSFFSFAVLAESRGTGPDPLRQGGAFAPLLRQWSQGVYHFNAIRTGVARRTPLGVMRPDLLPSGENLPQCLAFHFSQRSPVFDRVRATMAAILPDIGELVTPMEGTEIEIAFVDPTSEQRRNLKDLGSGVEQLLMIAYVGAAHPSGGLVLMEEPETSLHPGAQRELMRHLLDWGADRLFVATTHSPVFLDRTPTERGSTLLVSRTDGVSTVASADNDVRAVLHAVGVQLSDVLSAERIVLVEGESDASILRAWFPDMLMGRRSAIVPLGGGDRVYHLDTISRVLDGVDAIGRPVLFVRDRDEIVERRLSELERDSRVFLLARREFENYLLDEPEAIARVLTARSSRQDPFDAAEIAGLLREEADALRPVVVLKRTIEEALPPRLLDRRTVRTLLEDEPSRERLTAAVDERIAYVRQARDGLVEAWTAQERAVEAGWESDWRALAPGADVLAAVWRRVGLRYDKSADGARIAAATISPPTDIAAPLTAFLGEPAAATFPESVLRPARRRRRRTS